MVWTSSPLSRATFAVCPTISLARLAGMRMLLLAATGIEARSSRAMTWPASIGLTTMSISSRWSIRAASRPASRAPPTMRITARAASSGRRSRGADGRRPRDFFSSWARVEPVALASRSRRRDVRISVGEVISVR